LDQHERLQHRVVQVGGELGALLGPDPLPALGREVGHQPPPPRPGDQPDPGQHNQDRDQAVSGLRPPPGQRDERRHPGQHQRHPAADPEQYRAPGPALDHAAQLRGHLQPALPLGLVSLPPHDREPGAAE